MPLCTRSTNAASTRPRQSNFSCATSKGDKNRPQQVYYSTNKHSAKQYKIDKRKQLRQSNCIPYHVHACVRVGLCCVILCGTDKSIRGTKRRGESHWIKWSAKASQRRTIEEGKGEGKDKKYKQLHGYRSRYSWVCMLFTDKGIGWKIKYDNFVWKTKDLDINLGIGYCSCCALKLWVWL